MKLAETIRQRLDAMTKSERQVASYALCHLNDIAFYTLEQFAVQTGMSTTSVLRFCRRLDFDGFKPFQQAIRSELNYQPDLPDKFRRTLDSTDADALLAQTVRQDIVCIQQTFAALPCERLHRAVQLITQAGRVFTFGMRESFALAHYACSRLSSVRKNVHLLTAGHYGELESVLNLTADDVCLVYLFHRYTRQAVDILDLIRKQGASVILITSAPYDRLEPLACVLLPCQVDANGIKNSSVAPVCLADYLCNAVAVAGGDATLQHMRDSEALFRSANILGD